LLLGAVTLVVFWPQTSHEFISYDDPFYLTENPHVQQGLTWGNVAWVFRTGEAGNWHPLTWLSHMLDVQLFGLRPGWHHLTSLLFHAASAVLLFLLLLRMTDALWRSAFVAALFALHPLHVQSVAWAAERKDVLSAFFFMLTLLAYARYAKAESGMQQATATNTQHATRNTSRASILHPLSSIFYLLSLFFFALGLMSKPMLVTVPFVLLLLDFWPLGRLKLPWFEVQSSGFDIRGSRPAQDQSLPVNASAVAPPPSLWPLFLEKLPFLALSAASCIMTLWAQTGGGAVVPVTALSLPQRLANVPVACASYLAAMVWPKGLAILYPLGDTVSAVTLIAAGAVLVGITAWAVWRLRSRPYLAVGWFWFVGMLVPVIGLVQVGMQQRADRYTYLPLVGVFIMLAWEIPERLGAWRPARAVFSAGAILALLACVVATSRELSYWQDSEHLFRRALEVAPTNYIALDNYARALLRQGKVAEAMWSFEAAVALRPDLDAARCGLGTALMEQGKLDEAADQFSHVLALQPDHVAARLQLGIVRGRQGKLAEAAEAFSRVLRLRPDDAGAHNNLGNVLVLQGKHEEAVRQFEETVRLKPDHAGAYNNLAISCKKLGRVGDAIAHYREAIRLQPDSLQALNNLAWLLAAEPDGRFRNGAEAVALGTRACELTKYQNPVALTTLAAAYAETGRFQEAVSFAELAQKLAGPGQSALTGRLSAILEAVRANRSYHAD
jgi:Flp pilus assembly protein TadD